MDAVTLALAKKYTDAAVSTEGTPVISLTSAEYNALSDDEKNADVLYLITDAGGV